MSTKPTPTKEQQKAIEAGDGPLLIIAGAGTGKTFTITQRILYLVEEKEVKPEEILALTFTEKAAYEMKERVELNLPLGFPEIPISTFHSFCDEFLKNIAYDIGLNPNYKLMTQSDEVFFIRNHLFEFDLEYFRPKGNPVKFISEMVKHISRLQDENITPEEYDNYYKKESENLGEEERKKTFELVNFYKKYTHIKEENDRLGFGDLIYLTHKTLKEKDSLRKEWQSRFKYILIDEFQDTNYAQYELVKLLLGRNEKNPNVMVVADDDQSIYKFRGAAVSNVLQFTKDYPKAKRVVLTQNRRSHQEILDHAYYLIQNNNPDRLEVKEGISKELTSKAQGLAEFPVPIEFRNYLSEQDESEGIALEIEDIVSTSKTATSGQLSLGASSAALKLKDIAVLVRSHSHSEEITAALRRHGINYQFSGARKLFNKSEVKELVNFLKIVADYTDDISMNGVLDYEIWGLSDREIVELNILSRKSKSSIFEIIEEGMSNSKVDFIKVEPIVEYVKKAWGEVREGESTWQVLYNFVNESGYIENLSEEIADESEDVVRDVSEEFENQNKLRNIARLFDFLHQFESTNPDAKVYEFLDYLELILDSGESPLVDNADYQEQNAVSIITVHSSKGLEFPVVIIPSCVRGRFPSRNKREVIPIPDSLIKETLPEGDEQMGEERRLMYVAVTRGKSKVLLTAAAYYGEGKRRTKVSPFVVEMFGEKKLLPLIENPIDHEISLTEKLTDMKEESDEKYPKLKYISYTQFSDYNTCPRKYKYRYVLRIPTKPSPALSYGISIHNTLNKFYELLRVTKRGLLDNTKELTLEKLLDIYEDSWVSTGYINENHEKKAYEVGKKSLVKFYDEFFDLSQNPVFLEQNFNLKIGDVILRGKIDRLDEREEDGKTVYEIIDYKSGDSKKNQTQVNKDAQLAIYSLAAEKVFKIKADKLSLLFVDHSEKVTADGAKIDKLKDSIIEDISKAAENINKRIFTATPGFQCRFCEFNKICKYAQN